MATRTRNTHLTSPKRRIEVTQEVIDTSCRRDSSHCMVAEALKIAIPNAQFISVDLATIRFTDMEAGLRYVYLTPRRAQLAILDFDQGQKPEPFSFRIEGAQILPTGAARRAKARLQSPSAHETPGPNGGGSPIPVRIGGQAPPIGPLPGGAPKVRDRKDSQNPGAGAGNRTGKRREFGLRSIIR